MHRFLILFSIIFSACSSESVTEDKSLSIGLPSAQKGEAFNVIVETSAGEHFSSFYDDQTGQFERSDSATLSRFLPFPVNAGFIPKFSSDSTLHKIPVWLFSRRVETGQTVTGRPLAALNYTENSQAIQSFVLVPDQDSLDIYGVDSFEALAIQRDALKYAFEYWLRHRSGIGSISRIQWQDEVEAYAQLIDLINK